MISSYFRLNFVSCAIALCVFIPQLSWAEKANFGNFCTALAGHWQGSAAKLKQHPTQVSVQAICSADQQQLLVSVSSNANHNLSETWWFRRRGESAFLIYFDGVNEDKSQSFSLYRQYGSYTLLGEGELNKRPALIQLRFEPKGNGWLWLQNVQYLDDDTDRYLFYRGIDMMPVSLAENPRN
ncbi:hypothetical protein [Shewanella violacea]|uniref:DUF1579 domain-containing protein n=1 Tax=Shewanella violacea (strain JCM 10179 / CIP 106290 / LMG 19151 / DSS12) TaxID=637905 RepID=D4ZEI0_SHEVD|nr:hypothetical protein [Shewanella violacea]BAJ00210.1 conserved hypothetical protein [Shewanella violacea DSS12]